MKPTQKSSGASARKPRSSSDTGLMAAVPKPADSAKPRGVFDTPTDAVLTRYIDSRMKQFLTR